MNITKIIEQLKTLPPNTEVQAISIKDNYFSVYHGEFEYSLQETDLYIN